MDEADGYGEDSFGIMLVLINVMVIWIGIGYVVMELIVSAHRARRSLGLEAAAGTKDDKSGFSKTIESWMEHQVHYDDDDLADADDVTVVRRLMHRIERTYPCLN